MSHVIEMIGIRKEFPGIVANDNITLQVEEGEIHAILGENGAGKSSLFKIFAGIDFEQIKIEKDDMIIISANPIAIITIISAAALINPSLIFLLFTSCFKYPENTPVIKSKTFKHKYT